MSLEQALDQLDTPFLISSFIFGGLVGSFANVCISRWPHGESVVSPRSRCPKCKNSIAWYDNFPVISWLILGAKCRNCGLPISWLYPLVEAITAVSFALVYLRFGAIIAAPIYMFFVVCMIIVTFQDLTDWTIPDEISVWGIFIGLGVAFIGMFFPAAELRVTTPIDALLGIALGGGIIFTIDRLTLILLKKPGMGMGDVKLLAMIGSFVGWQGVLATLMLACLLGSVIGVSMILYFKSRGEGEGSATEADASGKNGDDTAGGDVKTETVIRSAEDDEDITLEGHYLPFGPYLALAGVVYIFIGPELIAMYIGWANLAGTL